MHFTRNDNKNCTVKLLFILICSIFIYINLYLSILFITSTIRWCWSEAVTLTSSFWFSIPRSRALRPCWHLRRPSRPGYRQSSRAWCSFSPASWRRPTHRPTRHLPVDYCRLTCARRCGITCYGSVSVRPSVTNHYCIKTAERIELILAYIGWRWRNSVPYLCQLTVAVILWVKLLEIFAYIQNKRTSQFPLEICPKVCTIKISSRHIDHRKVLST